MVRETGRVEAPDERAGAIRNAQVRVGPCLVSRPINKLYALEGDVVGDGQRDEDGIENGLEDGVECDGGVGVPLGVPGLKLKRPNNFDTFIKLIPILLLSRQRLK